MKDQKDKAALKTAFLKRVAEAFPGDFQTQAEEVAAVTLALEVAARQGRSSDDLTLLVKLAAGLDAPTSWAVEHLQSARSVIASPCQAEGVWKEALAVIHPLGMDLF